MSAVRVIALGNPEAGDDGAALAALPLVQHTVQLVNAGRPGARLLDLLSVETPTVLVDVTNGLGAAGRITSSTLEDIGDQLDARGQVSSHGFGPAETLRLAQALGRRLPQVRFVGIEGQSFDPGAALSLPVKDALPAFAAAIDTAIELTISSDPREPRDA